MDGKTLEAFPKNYCGFELGSAGKSHQHLSPSLDAGVPPLSGFLDIEMYVQKGKAWGCFPWD
jgi:hypothetical protein